MSSKHFVVQGAILKCQYGDGPDKLKVHTQNHHYTNDQKGSTKLTATDKDLGQTLEKNTFGTCKMQPLPSGGYRPCQAIITKWSGVYNKVTLSGNNGHPLLEDSKATCPIGGANCISILNHGQVSEPSAANLERMDDDVALTLFPFASIKNKKSKGTDIVP